MTNFGIREKSSLNSKVNRTPAFENKIFSVGKKCQKNLERFSNF